MSLEPSGADRLPARRASFILSIWSESQPDAHDTWRGYLEMPTGRRVYFDLLAELAHLVEDLCGWHDPPQAE